MYQYENKEAVHNKAKQIENIKIQDLIDKHNLHIVGRKNAMGDVFESWFGKPKDTSSEPDLGVSELKATPYRKLKNGQYSAKERLVLNMINYYDLAKENFLDSHFLKKNRVLEIAFYRYQKKVPINQQSFSHIIMYQLLKSGKDLEMIKKDWQTIHDYVEDGDAEDLSEGLTNYLSACTKSSNGKQRTHQPKSNVKVKPRAFAFKGSYMTQILRKYVFGEEDTDAIVKDPIELKGHSLKDIIYNRFVSYVGYSADELFKKFEISSNAKSKYNLLAKAILNLNTNNPSFNNVDELKKASLIMKTVNFNHKGTNKEDMSLPPFDFEDFMNETWNGDEDHDKANLNSYLSESTFIFIVFQEDENNNNIFKGIKFFHIPEEELNGKIKEAWQKTRNEIMNGVHLSYNYNRDRVQNDLISSKDEMIIHVRPHAAKASYINNNNASRLPTKAKWTNKPNDHDYSDYYMTKQSFWLNKPYVKSVVQDLLF